MIFNIVTHVTILTDVTPMLDTDNLLIPGLTRIAYVKCSDLPRHIRRMAQAGIIPTVSVESVDIDFFGDSKLEFSRSKDGKETSTLTFSSSDDIPLHDIAFIAQDRSGHRRIVGALEAPFPMVAVSESTGGSAADRRATTYTVTWAGRPAPVVIWMDDDNRLPIR